MDLGTYPSARCLDGSPGAYYYRPGTQSKNFVFFLEGGGWCYPSAPPDTPEDRDSSCLGRAQGPVGTTKHDAPTMTMAHGMLSTNAAESIFAGWNVVFVRYCDGGSFTGHLDHPVRMNSSNIYYRGRAILDGVFADVRARYSLATADQVVLSGGSAGGLATAVNCDHVASLVAPSPTRCIADAGFFLDVPDAVNGGMQVMRSRFFDIVDGMNATGQLPPDCVKSAAAAAAAAAASPAAVAATPSTVPVTAPNDPRACFFAEHALQYTKTPLFILNSLYNFMT